jgi:hypothetical protein
LHALGAGLPDEALMFRLRQRTTAGKHIHIAIVIVIKIGDHETREIHESSRKP